MQCTRSCQSSTLSSIPFSLARGKVGVTVFTDVDSFPGETPQGARQFVERLPRLLHNMLGRDAYLPRTLFSDRGPGFYHRFVGSITGEYETALRENPFRAWAGTNAKPGERAQPPDIPDVLLHETSISGLRSLLSESTPTKPWLETPEELQTRLQQVVRQINSEYDVDNLCREFPQRLHDLVHVTKGDRLKK